MARSCVGLNIDTNPDRADKRPFTEQLVRVYYVSGQNMASVIWFKSMPVHAMEGS